MLKFLAMLIVARLIADEIAASIGQALLPARKGNA